MCTTFRVVFCFLSVQFTKQQVRFPMKTLTFGAWWHEPNNGLELNLDEVSGTPEQCTQLQPRKYIMTSMNTLSGGSLGFIWEARNEYLFSEPAVCSFVCYGLRIRHAERYLLKDATNQLYLMASSYMAYREYCHWLKTKKIDHVNMILLASIQSNNIMHLIYNPCKIIGNCLAFGIPSSGR